MIDIRDNAGRHLYSIDENNQKIDISIYINSEQSKDYTYQIVGFLIVFTIFITIGISFIIN